MTMQDKNKFIRRISRYKYYYGGIYRNEFGRRFKGIEAIFYYFSQYDADVDINGLISSTTYIEDITGREQNNDDNRLL